MMTPITHPLAIAHAEASVAWSRVEFRSYTPEHTAYVPLPEPAEEVAGEVEGG